MYGVGRLTIVKILAVVGLLVSRLMRATLAGIAARKVGIKEPDYIAPEMLSNKYK